MLVVGLTGGIGSGKSTVANLFADYNVPIIDADVIARQLTQPHSATLQRIVEHFHEPLLKKDGSLDRSRLREIVFNQPAERVWLEKLLHPLIRADIERQVKQLSVPYCIVVIPLLFEGEPYSFIHRTLVVDAPQEILIERVAARDHTSLALAKTIVSTQVSREHRLAKADDVISNAGDPSALGPQVANLHTLYLKMSHSFNA